MSDGTEQGLTPDMRDMLVLFAKHKVRYLIVGAHAVNTYTEARMTKDLDLWISPDAENGRNAFKALVEFGAPLQRTTPADFSDPESFFVIGVKPNRIDILKKIPGVSFEEAWQKRNNVRLKDLEIPVLNAQDTLKAKLAAGRPQDILDAKKLSLYLTKIKGPSA